MAIDVDFWLDKYGQARARKNRSDGLRYEAAQYAWPSARDQVRGHRVTTEGQTNTLELYDSTALTAAYTTTSGLFSFLMPVGAFWFGFTAQDPKINNDQTLVEWMTKAASLTHKEIWRSNFQREMFLTIRSMVVFGTGIISVEKVGRDIVFKSHHVGFMSFEQNSHNEIDTVYRQIFYTARQATQEFGRDKVGDDVLKALEKDDTEQQFEYVQIVAPNNDFDKTKIGIKSKKFKSVYISIKDKNVVKEAGFDEIPYLVARFSLVPGEIMGRGPVIELLPEIKMLNRMKKTFIEASEKAVNPPMVMEDDGVIGPPVTEPNGVMYIRAGAQFPQPLDTGTNVALNSDIIAQQQQVVTDGLFANRFQSLADHKNMTAFEAGVRKEDDLTIVAPAVTSLQKETLDPLLSRVLNLLIKIGKIEPPPVSFDFDIAYQGRLSLAMASVQANAMEATLAKFAPYGQITPVFENVNWDIAFRTSWLSSGAPADALTDFKDMEDKRGQVEELQMNQAQSEIADNAANAYRKVAVTPEEGSPAEALL